MFEVRDGGPQPWSANASGIFLPKGIDGWTIPLWADSPLSGDA